MGGFCSILDTGKVSPLPVVDGGGIGCTPEMLSRFNPPIKHVQPDNPWLPILTPGQLAEIYAAFRKFDRDGDGHIEPKEIRRVMKDMGFLMSEDEAKKLIAGVDTDGNGMIEFDEFIGIMAEKMFNEKSNAEIDSMIFSHFDDGSGYVRIEVIKEQLCTMGFSKLSEQQFEQLRRLLAPDIDAEGKIPFEVFCNAQCWRNVAPPNAAADAEKRSTRRSMSSSNISPGSLRTGGATAVG